MFNLDFRRRNLHSTDFATCLGVSDVVCISTLGGLLVVVLDALHFPS